MREVRLPSCIATLQLMTLHRLVDEGARVGWWNRQQAYVLRYI